MAPEGDWKTHALAALEKLGRPEILIVGDLIIDEYITCRASHISLEAPIPVFYPLEGAVYLGGASNVAANVASVGCRPLLLGLAGVRCAPGEIYGIGPQVLDRFKGLCLERGVELHAVEVEERFFVRKRRYVADRQHVFRVDAVEEDEAAPQHYEKMLSEADRLLDRTGALLVIEMGHGTVTRRVARELVERARKRGLPVLGDSQMGRLGWLKGCSLLCPNVKELSQGCVEFCPEIGEEAALEAKGQALRWALRLDALLVTQSAEGMTLIEEDGAHKIPGVAVKVVDVTGAGDTVMALMGSCLASGVGMLEAAHLANTAAAVVVGKEGTSTTSRQELAQFLAL